MEDMERDKYLTNTQTIIIRQSEVQRSKLSPLNCPGTQPVTHLPNECRESSNLGGLKYRADLF